MSYNKMLLLATGLLVGLLTSHNAYAVNCGISYYCYRSMTPGPAPESSQTLARRATAANNRVAGRRAQPQRPNQRGVQQRAANTPQTLQQRQAEARRREQQQQQRVAQQRRRAQQLEQQRLAEVRRLQQQAQQRNARSNQSRQPAARSNNTAGNNSRAQLIAAQRRAHQIEQQQRQQRLERQRQAAQRHSQQAAQNARTRANTNTATATPATNPSTLTSASQAQQSCNVINQKIAELTRQAVLRSKEKQHDQAQRLFRAVNQLKKEATNKKCPGVV